MLEFKQALRRLRKTPISACAAVVSLGLGLGAVTATFSIYEALVLRPLPLPDPQSLVLVESRSTLFKDSSYISYPLFRELQAKASSLSGIAVYNRRPLGIVIDGQPRRVFGELVSENYDSLLGVSAAAGRTLTASDQARPVAVLLYDYWKTQFAGDPQAVGRKIRINSTEFTIIGVLQRGFRGLEVGAEVDLQIPVTMQRAATGGGDRLSQAGSWWLQGIGRLRPGVSERAANDEIRSLYSAMLQAGFFGPERLELAPGATGISSLRSKYSRQLVILFGATACLLLVTCLNLANFLFMRAHAHGPETSIMLSLGATRVGLMLCPIIESAVLALAGAIL